MKEVSSEYMKYIFSWREPNEKNGIIWRLSAPILRRKRQDGFIKENGGILRYQTGMTIILILERIGLIR